MDKKTRLEKAFEFASDATKQLITLSTAIITITITFAKDIFGGSINNKALLMISWISFLLSIVFGVGTLLALTGELEQTENNQREPTIRKKNVTLPSILQILLFIIALSLTIVFGIVEL